MLCWFSYIAVLFEFNDSHGHLSLVHAHLLEFDHSVFGSHRRTAAVVVLVSVAD